MSAVTVRVDDPAVRAAVVPVLASLPDDLVAAPADTGEVVVVDGGSPDWVSRLGSALTTASAVLLREPTVVSPVTQAPADADLAAALRALTRTAASRGVPVVVDRRWSGGPGAEAFAAHAAGQLAAASSVTALLVEADPGRSAADALLDLLGLARAAGVAVGRLDGLHRRGTGWAAWGSTRQGAVLHLQGVHCAAAGGATVSADSATGSARLHVPDGATAAPTTARLTTTEGEHLLPTDYEPAARTAWRRLTRRLAAARRSGSTGGVVSTEDPELAALADDVETAIRVLGSS